MPLSEAITYFDSDFQNRKSEVSPEHLLRMLHVLDTAVRKGLTGQMLEFRYSSQGLEATYQKIGEFLWRGKGNTRKHVKAGKSAFINQMTAEWSVMFARDKLMLYDLGLIAATGGDLRKAKPVNELDQALYVLRWRVFRENPERIHEVLDRIIRRGGPDAKKFLRRLGDRLALPAKELEDHLRALTCDKDRQLREYLLDCWANEQHLYGDKDAQGADGRGVTPPLWMFKDQDLYDCLHALATRFGELDKPTRLKAVLDLDSASLNMVWRRLGLIRPEPGWMRVEVEGTRRDLLSVRTIRIFDYKPISF